MKYYFFIFCYLASFSFAQAQIIFSEPFDEANGSTTGVDNTGGVAWNVLCPGCIAGDYFHVNSNLLECDDTNGPATWTTGTINTSACTGNILITMDIDGSNSTNALDECAAGCGCNCVDWILVEYSLNGGSFASASSSQGGPCVQGCSGGNYAVLGALTANPFAFTYCIPSTGNTLVLRITLQTWAQGERYQIDNVVVQCFNCVLPVNILNFEAKAENEKIHLSWETASENSINYFCIQRSNTGENYYCIDSVYASGSLNLFKQYNFTDNNFNDGVNYYRLKEVNKNGEIFYSKTIAVNSPNSEKLSAFFNNGELIVKGSKKHESIEIIDFTGRKLNQFTSSGATFTLNLSLPKGMYILYGNNNNSTRQAVFYVY